VSAPLASLAAALSQPSTTCWLLLCAAKYCTYRPQVSPKRPAKQSYAKKDITTCSRRETKEVWWRTNERRRDDFKQIEKPAKSYKMALWRARQTLLLGVYPVTKDWRGGVRVVTVPYWYLSLVGPRCVVGAWTNEFVLDISYLYICTSVSDEGRKQ
jgi:hypothetical protein